MYHQPVVNTPRGQILMPSDSRLDRYHRLLDLRKQGRRQEDEPWIPSWLDHEIERELDKWERRNINPKYWANPVPGVNQKKKVNVPTAIPALEPGKSPVVVPNDSAPPSAGNGFIMKHAELFSLQRASAANGRKLSERDREFARNVVREFGSGCLYEVLAETRRKLTVEEEIKRWEKAIGKGKGNK